MDDENFVRRSSRLRPTAKIDESDQASSSKKIERKKQSNDEFASKSKKMLKDESSSPELPKRVQKSKKRMSKNTEILEPKRSRQEKKCEEKENVNDTIDELEALQDLPELNAPRDWLNMLEADPSTSENVSPAKHDTLMDDYSSEEDWHEVEAPKVQVKKSNVEVRIEKEHNKEREQMEKMLRLQVEREMRESLEDCHKLHFLTYLVHLRYQMTCIKEFCSTYKDELHELLDYDLFNDSNLSLDEKFGNFRIRFTRTKDALCEERSKKETIQRLHSILKDKIFQTNKDLAMAFMVLFMSAEFPFRLCVGFTPGFDLPTSKKITPKKVSDEDKPSTSKANKKEVAKQELNYWAEYFDENEWIPVHPVNKEICNSEDIEKYAPFNYALGIDNDLNVLDITGWYVKKFLSSAFRKTRLDNTWIQSFLTMPEFCSSKKHAMIEAQKLRTYLLSKPIPRVISEYKHHPLYALERDLLKFEAFYPPDIKPLGKISNHDIYPRSAICTLQGELNWIRQARSVKENEEPYKIVKARPKLSIPVEERVPLFLNTYGYWQTEPYVAPKVVDGKIPRNEFGNVYMYQPQMVPEDCVHLKMKGVLAMARSLDMEAVPAVVGWEFSGGRNHPIIEGCVVLEKDAEILRNACAEWMEIRTQKKMKVVEDRGLQLWKRFVKGKLLLEKMKKRFNVK